MTVAADVLLKNSGVQTDVKPSTQEIALASKAFHQLLMCGNSYKPTKKFNGDVCLIKASKLRKRASILPEDYGLSACITGKVGIRVVEGSHENFVMGRSALACADVIRTFVK